MNGSHRVRMVWRNKHLLIDPIGGKRISGDTDLGHPFCRHSGRTEQRLIVRIATMTHELTMAGFSIGTGFTVVPQISKPKETDSPIVVLRGY